jgi:hypothetical protein
MWNLAHVKTVGASQVTGKLFHRQAVLIEDGAI